jgi:predicted dehydrogenase
MAKKINVAIIGLGFGAEFIPIYQAHPDANLVAVCQRDPKKLKTIQDAFGIAKGFTDYDELLRDPEIDAVHINTPIPDHAAQSIKALKAGKHVACTVPMATSIEDCRKIVELTRKSGLKYMMMETVVYAREYLYIKELYDKGELGKIQFLQASHQQDMDGWPNYWPGLPPMWYATHCVGPMLALTDAAAEYVSCFGSGTIRKELIKQYGSPFAVETAHVKLKDSDLTARIIRSLFDVARQYRESIDVYGSKKSFEWTLIEHEPHVLHTAKLAEAKIPKKIQVPENPSAGLREATSEKHPEIHYERRVRSREENAPQLHSRRRPRRVASSLGPRVSHRIGGRSRSLSECGKVRQLDLRWTLRSRIRVGRREDREVAGVYPGIVLPRGNSPWGYVEPTSQGRSFSFLVLVLVLSNGVKNEERERKRTTGTIVSARGPSSPRVDP